MDYRVQQTATQFSFAPFRADSVRRMILWTAITLAIALVWRHYAPRMHPDLHRAGYFIPAFIFLRELNDVVRVFNLRYIVDSATRTVYRKRFGAPQPIAGFDELTIARQSYFGAWNYSLAREREALLRPHPISPFFHGEGRRAQRQFEQQVLLPLIERTGGAIID